MIEHFECVGGVAENLEAVKIVECFVLNAHDHYLRQIAGQIDDTNADPTKNLVV